MIVEGLTIHCFSMSTENLEWAGVLCGMSARTCTRTHKYMHT